MSEGRRYTAQLQAGLGMVNETMALLRLWEPGDTPIRLADRAIEHGVFARATGRRARNIVVEMFGPRYLVDGGKPAASLQKLLAARQPLEDLTQLFFLYTARAQRILRDFVTDVYWPQYMGGAIRLSREHAESFIRRAIDAGCMHKRWTESTIRRVSGYLIGACADFGLLAGSARSDRTIQRFTVRPAVALYLAYDLHFAGHGDGAVLGHVDWRLFGFDAVEAVAVLKSLAQDGHLIVQVGGDVLHVTWKYRCMEECIRALTEG